MKMNFGASLDASIRHHFGLNPRIGVDPCLAALRLGRHWIYRAERLPILRLGGARQRVPRSGRLCKTDAADAPA